MISQVVEDGYEFFADRQLVTIFSAPNYCGEFDNAGAMMSVDESLMCSFQILKPSERRRFLWSEYCCSHHFLFRLVSSSFWLCRWHWYLMWILIVLGPLLAASFPWSVCAFVGCNAFPPLDCHNSIGGGRAICFFPLYLLLTLSKNQIIYEYFFSCSAGICFLSFIIADKIIVSPWSTIFEDVCPIKSCRGFSVMPRSSLRKNCDCSISRKKHLVALGNTIVFCRLGLASCNSLVHIELCSPRMIRLKCFFESKILSLDSYVSSNGAGGFQLLSSVLIIGHTTVTNSVRHLNLSSGSKWTTLLFKMLTFTFEFYKTSDWVPTSNSLIRPTRIWSIQWRKFGEVDNGVV